MITNSQMYLFPDQDHGQNLNIIQDLKRQIRVALSRSPLSRDQIVDRMNSMAARNGLKSNISKAVLDGWTKESQPERLPGIVGLTLLCKVLESVNPLRVILNALGSDAIGPDDLKILSYGKAEIAKKKAMKRARIAAEVLDI